MLCPVFESLSRYKDWMNGEIITCDPINKGVTGNIISPVAFKGFNLQDLVVQSLESECKTNISRLPLVISLMAEKSFVLRKVIAGSSVS